jgi:hypothetical protein
MFAISQHKLTNPSFRRKNAGRHFSRQALPGKQQSRVFARFTPRSAAADIPVVRNKPRRASIRMPEYERSSSKRAEVACRARTPIQSERHTSQQTHFTSKSMTIPDLRASDLITSSHTTAKICLSTRSARLPRAFAVSICDLALRS